MKTKNIIFAITLLIVMCCNLNKSYGQATSANGFNTPITPGVDYIGWANTVYYPLQIRTDATGGNAQQIQFLTNGNPSGQIDPTLTNNTSFGYLTFGSLTTGFANSLFGSNAGFSITRGFRNSFFGDSAGYFNMPTMQDL